VFFEDRDRELYLSLLREYIAKYQVQILGYCLMTNHVHLIAVPADATGLAKAIGRVHNDYARWLHIRRRESGHLWQNRFFSCPLEDAYTWAALAYVERNAVRAGMVAQCEEWAWGSARQHLSTTDWCDWLALQSGRKTGRRSFGGLRSRKVSSRRTSEPDCTRQPEREDP